MRFTTRLASIGGILFALGSVGSGIIDLLWGQFEAAHRPIQAWGDHIPGLKLLLWTSAVALIAAGVIVAFERFRRQGAIVLATLYFVFSIFSLPRLLTAPRILGHSFSVYVVVLVTSFQQLILAIAAGCIVENKSRVAGPCAFRRSVLVRGLFGICLCDFGLAHFTSTQAVAAIIPTWMPFNATFLTLISGIAFILFGAAILLRRYDIWAAQGLGVMLATFSAVVLMPRLLQNPHSQIVWGGNAYNITAIGAACVFASWLSAQPSNSPAAGVVSPRGC